MIIYLSRHLLDYYTKENLNFSEHFGRDASCQQCEQHQWLMSRCLTDSEVPVEMADWVIDTGHSRGRFNYYMHNNNLYWHLKALLSRVMIAQNEAKEEILLLHTY